MADEKLLRYFMDQTEKRLDLLSTQVEGLHEKMDSLNEFKVKTIVNSRWISVIVSSALGAVTLISSIVVSIYVSREERKSLMDAAEIEKPLPQKANHS